jgi:cyclopropane-fatty-acyl-phospholipid synthase
VIGFVFDQLIRNGTLQVISSGGTERGYGAGSPCVTIRFLDRMAPVALALHPDFMLGQLYMDGRLVVENGTIADLLALFFVNLEAAPKNALHESFRLWRRLTRRLAQFNPVSQARRHVANHYDLSDRLYEMFLDSDKQYSCAYFATGNETLDEAQKAKKCHIAAKMNLDRPGLKVLDIGCGWGGLALDLASEMGADVLGITLSERQVATARKRSKAARLGEHCRFELVDYRQLSGTYDRIVSVGMFEHVGIAYYPAFFAKVRELLDDDGVMVLHCIGRLDGPGATNPWIAKYIFPGGYVPALSEITAPLERSGLFIADVEVLRLHYAETLWEWRRRFLANRDEVARLYDERFCRMWEFYLAGSEMAFRYGGQVVFQLQLVKDINALPLTRDYMLDRERILRSSAAATALRVGE